MTSRSATPGAALNCWGRPFLGPAKSADAGLFRAPCPTVPAPGQDGPLEEGVPLGLDRLIDGQPHELVILSGGQRERRYVVAQGPGRRQQLRPPRSSPPLLPVLPVSQSKLTS